MTGGDDPASRILEGVVPRWEFRVFGTQVDGFDALVDGITPERVASSHEQYFLSVHTNASVKVRDGAMDVKERLSVDDHGLELWAPTLEAEFPVTASAVATVFQTLGAGVPGDLSDEYSIDALVELIGIHDDLMIVGVEKHRRHFEIDGCMAESTAFSVDGSQTRSITLESSDPRLVVRTRRRIGLDRWPNLSVARGLKALLEFGSSLVAFIEVGTSSVTFHLEEHTSDGAASTLVDRTDATRPDEQADDGVIDATAIARTVDSIVAMVTEARALGPATIVAVGTAGLRQAPNGADLVDQVRCEVGIDVDFFSGPDEVRPARRCW